ncbi:MAG: hypothetical protein Q9187_003665 [Circinaria calcarea]
MRPLPTPSPARPSAPPVSQSGDVAIELARINLERERLVSERERERLALERKKADHQIAMDMMRLGENRGRRCRHNPVGAVLGLPPHVTVVPPTTKATVLQGPQPIRVMGIKVDRQQGHDTRAPVPPTPAVAPAYTPKEFSRNWVPRQGIRAGNQALHDSQANRARLRAREREMESMKQKIAAKELDEKKKAEAARAITARAGQLDGQTSTIPSEIDERLERTSKSYIEEAYKYLREAVGVVMNVKANQDGQTVILHIVLMNDARPTILVLGVDRLIDLPIVRLLGVYIKFLIFRFWFSILGPGYSCTFTSLLHTFFGSFIVCHGKCVADAERMARLQPKVDSMKSRITVSSPAAAVLSFFPQLEYAVYNRFHAPPCSTISYERGRLHQQAVDLCRRWTKPFEPPLLSQALVLYRSAPAKDMDKGSLD